MHRTSSWLLPRGIEEVLPKNAKHLESLRRKLLDAFACWGYELVIPPIVDFLDSLLVGSGHDLDLQTFKFVDQVSGKLLGIRADITPLVARIDAHNFKCERPTRLCYAGTTLKTSENALEKSRSPIQIGAEIYGHSGIESDLEVIRLMLEALTLAGLENIHLDLGHVGVYRSLSKCANLTKTQEIELFSVLQRKARAELSELVNSYKIDNKLKLIFTLLPTLSGEEEVLDRAAKILANTNNKVILALTELQTIAKKLSLYHPSLPVSFDLSELRGYHYHTGVVFAAFIPKVGREVARGGRYDNIGEFFGRARAATGFSTDLRLLSSLQNTKNEKMQLIYAPLVDDASLMATIKELRDKGLVVVQQLPGHLDEIKQLLCTDVLEKENQHWVVKSLT